MASRSQPPGEVRVDAHSLIRLRERTVYPQLTDVPSDLRVNGARHASRESLPPSKPCRPPEVRPGHPELNQRPRSLDADALLRILPRPDLSRPRIDSTTVA